MLQIILASVLIMFASLIGAISVWKNLGGIIEKNLHYLVSFSAGIFAIIAYNLAYEAIEHLPLFINALTWIAMGAVLSLLIFKFLPHFHNHNESKIDARRLMWSDAVHNIGDGILLAAAFSVNSALGFATAISVFIHEIIQEIGEFFVLKQAGYSTKKTLIINFLTSGSILIGSIGGFFLLERFETIEAPLLGITAGAFLVVIFHDLIPHSIDSIHSKGHIVRHIALFAFGLLIMFLVNSLIPHLH